MGAAVWGFGGGGGGGLEGLGVWGMKVVMFFGVWNPLGFGTFRPSLELFRFWKLMNSGVSG